MEESRKKNAAVKVKDFKRSCDQVIATASGLFLYYIEAKDTSGFSFITELKANVVAVWSLTSVGDLAINCETICFTSFLIFLACSQIMCESLEKTMGHARLECLIFTLRCVLKIPNPLLQILTCIHTEKHICKC